MHSCYGDSALEMSTVHNPIESYVLGNTLQGQERLKLQGRFLEKWTEQFFLSAGLEPGMNVLDLGCGMGDVSLLAARLVGTTGRVTKPSISKLNLSVSFSLGLGLGMCHEYKTRI
jgi:2-polyprenyl-3-methyl-5-hydroxy-6-metoxy-1,4-benzoquinol methylase